LYLCSNSKLVSILFSTACLVAFGLLTGPVIKPASRVSGGIEIHPSKNAEQWGGEVRVIAGKSMIVESSANIARFSVDHPELARTSALNEHELLVNAQTPGRTRITIWQEDGGHRQFDLCIGSQVVETHVQVNEVGRHESRLPLTSAYQDAMDRVQTAITGAAR
jgi:Flp pilus assembly secretin CpaC